MMISFKAPHASEFMVNVEREKYKYIFLTSLELTPRTLPKDRR